MMLDIQYICLSRFRVSLSDKLRFVWPHLLGVKLASRQNPAESCMICLDPGLRHCKIAPCSTREVSLKMGVDYFSKSLSLSASDLKLFQCWVSSQISGCLRWNFSPPVISGSQPCCCGGSPNPLHSAPTAARDPGCPGCPGCPDAARGDCRFPGRGPRRGWLGRCW